MDGILRRCVAMVLVSAMLLFCAKQAKGESLQSAAVEVVIGVAAAGAAIGIGIYYLVRQPPSITGCAGSGANGLSLKNEGDQRTYLLIGDLANVKTGERIRVSGKKKKDAAGNPEFLVEKLSKDFGACMVLPATP